MITCPKCQSTLPDWATSCQFCGTDVGKVARPVAAPTQKRVYGYAPAPWVWVTYYVIAAYWVLGDLLEIVKTCLDKSGPNPIVIVFAGVGALIGLGLICHVELARGIGNIYAWLKMLGGAWWVLVSFGAMLLYPPLGIALFLLGVFDIVSAGLLIYLIGETSKYAPS